MGGIQFGKAADPHTHGCDTKCSINEIQYNKWLNDKSATNSTSLFSSVDCTDEKGDRIECFNTTGPQSANLGDRPCCCYVNMWEHGAETDNCDEPSSYGQTMKK